jgi:hypothetical protein
VSAQPLAGEAASLINKRKFRNEFSYKVSGVSKQKFRDLGIKELRNSDKKEIRSTEYLQSLNS